MKIKKIIGRKLVDYELPMKYNLQAYFKVKRDLYDKLEELLKGSSYWLAAGRLISVQDNGEDGIILIFSYMVFEKKEVHIPWSVVNSWDIE